MKHSSEFGDSEQCSPISIDRNALLILFWIIYFGCSNLSPQSLLLSFPLDTKFNTKGKNLNRKKKKTYSMVIRTKLRKEKQMQKSIKCANLIYWKWKNYRILFTMTSLGKRIVYSQKVYYDLSFCSSSTSNEGGQGWNSPNLDVLFGSRSI